jgi:glycosyltransferase involved in cell wall biosynthesis
MIKLSVILCTHNPDTAMLTLVIAGLKAQTMEKADWEFVLIDNRSINPLSAEMVNWHSQGRIVRDEKIGLTAARVRGIAESRGSLIVFVDDDAVLDADYLRQAIAVSNANPQVGVFGGNVELRMEIPVPAYYLPHLALLAERKVERDTWGCMYLDQITPCGVGMLVRRPIAEAYRNNTRGLRAGLGRKGNMLTSGEDNDIAYTACDMGMAIGLFTALHLTHLIPKERLTRAYMSRLIEGISFSTSVLASTRPAMHGVLTAKHRLLKLAEYILAGKLTVAVAIAKVRGQMRARKYLRQHAAGIENTLLS